MMMIAPHRPNSLHTMPQPTNISRALAYALDPVLWSRDVVGWTPDRLRRAVQSLADIANITRRNGRCGITPAVADICEDGGYVRIRQLPGKGQHSLGRSERCVATAREPSSTTRIRLTLAVAQGTGF